MESMYKVIGLMSGTSLDGLDIAYCEFTERNNQWAFRLVASKEINYPREMINMFQHLPGVTGIELLKEHKEYGRFLGAKTREFCLDNRIEPDLISSHGHTIFHQPESGLTFQLGDGAAMAAASGYPVVCDFRSQDVELGGQGAPLVPMGDRLLFGQYDCCLNLGGFSNLSFESEGQRMAFDVCPVNMILNHISMKMGYPYDDKGNMASQGTIDNDLLEKLNSLEYYQEPPPKSLGREWFEINFFPLLNRYEGEDVDLLRTMSAHIAYQIDRALLYANLTSSSKVLVTGGGAKNEFLMEQLRSSITSELALPDEKIIDFKEAIVFGLLGTLRWRNEINCLSSVTGAFRDSSCGAIYLP